MALGVPLRRLGEDQAVKSRRAKRVRFILSPVSRILGLYGTRALYPGEPAKRGLDLVADRVAGGHARSGTAHGVQPVRTHLAVYRLQLLARSLVWWCPAEHQAYQAR